ncbi:MAG: LacI family transcriptional regulator, partial [Actinomycetales bacterium]|nr:LacI family transcriptional regulator [Actinomycetales bacterium]
LGKIAANKLFAAIDGEELGGGVEMVPCRLVPRESTTPLS